MVAAFKLCDRDQWRECGGDEVDEAKSKVCEHGERG